MLTKANTCVTIDMEACRHEVVVVCRDIAALVEHSEKKAYTSNELSVAQ